MITRSALAIAIAGAASACGSDTASPTRNEIAVSVNVVGTPTFSIGQDSDGSPLATCDVSLAATATGQGAATWKDATFYWYTGLDRTKLQDSAIALAADVQASWSHPDIASSQQEQGGWQVSDWLPFDLEIVFRYAMTSPGDARSTRTRFTCGPAVPQGAVAPPAISQLGLSQRVQWQPSDTLAVQFKASSATGVWLTYTAFTGAFASDTIVSEALQPSVQRVVQKRIPAPATLGMPVVATVFAFDAFGQQVGQSIQTSSLVDVTRPVMQLAMFAPPYRVFTTNIGGTYFVGDSIDLVPAAGDNHGLNAFVWHATQGIYSDSIVAKGDSGAGGQLLIPVHQDWNDGLQFRFYSIDLTGNVSDTVTTPPHAFKFYPTMSRPTVVAPLTGDVGDALIDTARSAVYVLQGNQHRVAIHSLTTLQQTGTVALPGYPQSLDITPGGDSLIVVLRLGELAVIDLQHPSNAPTVIALNGVDINAGQYSDQARIAANDRLFVVLTGQTAAQHQLLEVNLATGTQRIRSDAGAAFAVSRSLDQRVLTVAGNLCVERYDVATDAFTACTIMYQNPALPSVDRTGEHFGIQLTAFDASLAPVATVQFPWNLGNAWLPTTISADGAYIFYYFFPIGVIRARVADGVILDRTIVPGFDPTDIRISPDGTKMLLAADDGATATGHLAVIDLRDADAQPLQLARAPLMLSPLRSTSITRPSTSRSRSARPPRWKATPPPPRPWRAITRDSVGSTGARR
jgi:hypothetical protein